MPSTVAGVAPAAFDWVSAVVVPFVTATVAAGFTAWVTALYTLRRDRHLWSKEIDEPIFVEAQQCIGGIIEWVRQFPKSGAYPSAQLLGVQRALLAVGAGHLLPLLAAVGSRIDTLSPTAAGQYETLVGCRGDLLELGLRLHNHRRSQLGLKERPVDRRQMDA